jgi:hypothetical protein
VFDGLAQLVSESGSSAAASDVPTAPSPNAVEPPIPSPATQPSLPPAAGATFDGTTGPTPASAARWLRREWRAIAASALLLLLLVAQLALRQRDMLAAQHPALRGILATLCAIAGCEVRLPRVADRLSIEGDEMIAPDPKEPSRIVLVATLRNSAPFPVAYPSLELSLQNAREETVARRVLGPVEYLEPGSDLSGGLAANSDVHLRLAVDTGTLRAEGYRLYLFYP